MGIVINRKPIALAGVAFLGLGALPALTEEAAASPITTLRNDYNKMDLPALIGGTDGVFATAPLDWEMLGVAAYEISNSTGVAQRLTAFSFPAYSGVPLSDVSAVLFSYYGSRDAMTAQWQSDEPLAGALDLGIPVPVGDAGLDVLGSQRWDYRIELGSDGVVLAPGESGYCCVTIVVPELGDREGWYLAGGSPDAPVLSDDFFGIGPLSGPLEPISSYEIFESGLVFNAWSTPVEDIPEPSSMVLLASGLAVLIARRRRGTQGGS